MQVRKQQLELDMEQQTGSKLGEVYVKAVYFHPAYLTSMQSYIMRNAGLDEAQAGIKIAGRNINHLRYADDTTFMAESEEELQSLLMKVKEESDKVGLKLNTQRTKIMASGPITSWEIEGETVETVSDFIFGRTGSSLLQELPSGCGVRASRCGGLSCCRAQALEHRLDSCGTPA